jgi:hypothetical protein
MTSFVKLATLDRLHSRVLFFTWLILLATRVLLCIGGFRFCWNTIVCLAVGWTPTSVSERELVTCIRWAAIVASRYVPGARCLHRTIAVQALLYRSSIRCTVCFGVVRTTANKFVAHSWVMSNGEIVVGDIKGLNLFSRLSEIKGGLL